MPLQVFELLAKFCRENTTLRDSWRTSVEEKLYVFLYIVGQEGKSRNVQEVFSHSGESISRLVERRYVS